MKDVEEDEKAGIRYSGIYWTLGRYDSVVIIEAPDEKAAMNMAAKRLDRMEITTLVAVPENASKPSWRRDQA